MAADLPLADTSDSERNERGLIAKADSLVLTGIDPPGTGSQWVSLGLLGRFGADRVGPVG